jgi:hypothetical protein
LKLRAQYENHTCVEGGAPYAFTGGSSHLHEEYKQDVRQQIRQQKSYPQRKGPGSFVPPGARKAIQYDFQNPRAQIDIAV